MPIRTRVLLPSLLWLAVIAGCAGDSDETTGSTADEATPTSNPSSASTSASAAAGEERFDGCPNAPGGSSDATFDEDVGVYAATITELGPSGATVTFDVVQWLVGEEAAEAYRSDNPDEVDGPPNDYYIVNLDDRLRTAPVDLAARALVVALSDDSSADVSTITLDDLVTYLDAGTAGPFWLSFENGTVTEICEQYVP